MRRLGRLLARLNTTTEEENESELVQQVHGRQPVVQPPPPSPDIAEVLANQTQLLQRMVEAVERRINGENFQGPPEEDLMQKIERFIRLKPPTFSYSDNPLDVDDWLRVIESKLDLTNSTNEECFAIVAHQLEGSAKSWWDNYSNNHSNPAHIAWLEFCEAFHKQFLPQETMIQKAQEFRTMTQGNMTVVQYERHFMKMMRYAEDDTKTDDQKQFWFMRGLHYGLRKSLKASEHKSLCHLVNRAIALEEERRMHEGEEKKERSETP
jgi:hypothetical protein